MFKDFAQLLTLDNVDKIIRVLAVVVGGVLAYYRFFKGRVYTTRLEPKITGTVDCLDGVNYVIVTACVKNVGISKVDINHKGSSITIGSSHKELKTLPYTVTIDWVDLAELSIFQSHSWIEAGETIEDQRMLAVPSCEHLAFRLELGIASRGIVWRAVSIIKSDWKNGQPEHSLLDLYLNK